MPHGLNDAEVDERYPSFKVAADRELQDLSWLEHERLYAAGVAIAREILHKMAAVGRTRRARSATQAEPSPAIPGDTYSTAIGKKEESLSEAPVGMPVGPLPTVTGNRDKLPAKVAWADMED